MSNDVLPTLLGIALVAAAAAFALLPLARGSRPEALASSEPGPMDRFAVYRQVLELELDLQLGKLSSADYQQQSADLLARAGESLREERGTLGEVDDDIEREIAAARAAFAAVRTGTSSAGSESPPTAEQESARATSTPS